MMESSTATFNMQFRDDNHLFSFACCKPSADTPKPDQPAKPVYFHSSVAFSVAEKQATRSPMGRTA